MSRETVAWVTSKPCSVERVDELALAADRARRDELADRPLAEALELLAVRSTVLGVAVRGRSCRADAGRPDRGDARPERRVVEGARRARRAADESAMIASAPSQPSAAERGPDLGHHAAGDDAGLDEVSRPRPTVSVSSRRPSASRTPSTSVSSTSWRAPSPAAIPAATSSALTLQTMPSASRASGATTGTWPPTRIASSRSRRRPTTRATSPSSGMRSAMSRPPSTPDRPTASTPRSRSPATSSLLTTPRRTAAATSSDCGVGHAEAALERLGTPRRSSHSVMRLPPPWTRTTGRRRATAATSASTCALVGDRRAAELDDEDLAHVVYSEFSMHVGLGQVAAEGLAGAVAEAEVERDHDLGGVHRRARRGAIELDRAARGRRRTRDGRRSRSGGGRGSSTAGVPARDRRLVGASGRRPRAPRRSASRALPAAPGDPAPVRVAAVGRGLDQARRDDRAGHGPGLGVVARAGHRRP